MKKNEAFKHQAIVIENIFPQIDNGVFAVKTLAEQNFEVFADIYKDGHDLLDAAVLYRKASDKVWQFAPMHALDNDRWTGAFTPTENARYQYTVEAWVNPLRNWFYFMEKRCRAQVWTNGDLLEGVELLKRWAKVLYPQDQKTVGEWILGLQKKENVEPLVLKLAQDPHWRKKILEFPIKDHISQHKILELMADRAAAAFGAWYEIFPRSQGGHAHKSGTFKDCIARLPKIQKMGFDVLYLAPIHPIGKKNRKGANNSLKPEPGAPGSPWAIGSDEGGHKAIHPDLGTLADFRNFAKQAQAHGMEIALDLAYQCSPDHPYAQEHPDWFFQLPDGSIRYAENPPKKYEDIYPLNFHCADWENLWKELKDIVLFWIKNGVKIFRVDNPHTKPLHFWKWLIDSVQQTHPDVIFLAEAFTRPKMMKFLAKAGFTQSYTYFTWRNHKWELQDYLAELTQSEMKWYFRGNFFANTPDILPEILQIGGAAAFKMRLVLAATLSSVYGIYNGFELCEGQVLKPGTEDYLDSEKYQYRVWDWERAGHIKNYIAQVNAARKAHPALQQNNNLEFYKTNNDAILCYAKKTNDLKDIIICVVNLDPFHIQEDAISIPAQSLGLEPGAAYNVEDLLTGNRYQWRADRNYVRLDPTAQPCHIFKVIK